MTDTTLVITILTITITITTTTKITTTIGNIKVSRMMIISKNGVLLVDRYTSQIHFFIQQELTECLLFAKY